MGISRNSIILTILLLSFITQAQAKGLCLDFFSQSANKTQDSIITSIDLLDNNIAHKFKSIPAENIEQMFLFLKQVYYQYSSDYILIGRGNKKLSQHQINHINENINFKSQPKNEEEYTQFFLNAIAAQANRLILPIYEKWISELPNNYLNNKEVSIGFILSEIHKTDLWDRTVSPKDFKELIEVRPWQSLTNNRTMSNEASETHKNKFLKSKRKTRCCASSSGCRVCPTNRKHL